MNYDSEGHALISIICVQNFFFSPIYKLLKNPTMMNNTN